MIAALILIFLLGVLLVSYSRLARKQKDLLDWAEAIICSAKSDCHEEAEWNRVVKNWRDAKHSGLRL